MNKTKLLLTLVLAFAFLFAQVGNVAAAPAQGTTPITGTVTQVTCQTDSAGTNTFTVTLDTSSGSQTVTIDQQTAIGLGLVTADGSGNVDCTSDAVTQELLADAGKTESITPTTTEESVNPISTLLGAFFGVDASTIDTWHSDNHFGFGVIAQALWIAKNLDDSTITFDQILTAKQTGDYSAFFPAGTTDLPTNWGQFKKELLNKHNNLGNVVSGHANDEDTSHPGKGNGNGNGQGNGKGNNNSQGGGNGNNGNGNGHKP
jgi:hypothetical protein